MPRRTPSLNQPTPQPTRPSHFQAASHRNAPPTVDPRWIFKGLLIVVAAAILCGYLSLCLLFYVGQWQIVLHPTRTTTHPAAISGTPIQFFSFAPDDSAVPQLTGWFVPALPGSRYSNATMLYLPSGDGSLAEAVPALTALHDLGVNVFAIDYRGYGQSSSSIHPSQKVLFEDAESAWRYLHTSRSLPDSQIVPYGVGVGAPLAVYLATNHPAFRAVILDSPHADLLDAAAKDDRTKLIPARLFFHERFPLAVPLSSLRTPKLLLSGTQPPASFQHALDPRMTIEFNAVAGTFATQPTYAPSITRFLDQYLPTAPPQLMPPVTPAQTR